MEMSVKPINLSNHIHAPQVKNSWFMKYHYVIKTKPKLHSTCVAQQQCHKGHEVNS